MQGQVWPCTSTALPLMSARAFLVFLAVHVRLLLLLKRHVALIDMKPDTTDVT